MEKKTKPISWVKKALMAIQAGKTVQIRPHGNSMSGRIESGRLITLTPATSLEIKVDDIVFLKWKNNYLLHLVKEIGENQFLIGNNLGKINGWVPSQNILAKVIDVES